MSILNINPRNSAILDHWSIENTGLTCRWLDGSEVNTTVSAEQRRYLVSLYDVDTYRFIGWINQHVPNVTINGTCIRTTTLSSYHAQLLWRWKRRTRNGGPENAGPGQWTTNSEWKAPSECKMYAIEMRFYRRPCHGSRGGSTRGEGRGTPHPKWKMWPHSSTYSPPFWPSLPRLSLK